MYILYPPFHWTRHEGDTINGVYTAVVAVDHPVHRVGMIAWDVAGQNREISSGDRSIVLKITKIEPFRH